MENKRGIIIITNVIALPTDSINMLSIKDHTIIIYLKYPIIDQGLAPVHHITLTFKNETELVSCYNTIIHAIHTNTTNIVTP